MAKNHKYAMAGLLPLQFGMDRPQYQPPIAHCTFCGAAIETEAHRLPNPDSCLKLDCKTKWKIERDKTNEVRKGAGNNNGLEQDKQ